MDIYSKPQPSAYITGLTKWFQMPEGNTTIPAVAVSRDTGDNWNSAYTILITLIFIAVGKLLGDFVITYFPVNDNGNRGMILVGYYNTGDPVASIALMSTYIFRLLFRIRVERKDPQADEGSNRNQRSISRIDWGTLLLVLVLWTIVASIFAGSIVAGILIPANLLMGSKARVNPDAIFVPLVRAELSAVEREAYQRIIRAAVSRAIGTVEYSRGLLSERVTFGPKEKVFVKSDRPELRLNYHYELTGNDFGLQRAPSFLYRVNAHCQTEYSWYKKDLSNSSIETYSLWNENKPENLIPVPVEARLPPRGQFLFPPSHIDELESSGKARFAIIPHLAGRPCLNSNTKDPWYLTEPNPDSDATSGEYRIRAGRPALSCEQTSSWEYGGLKENSVLSLKNLLDIGMKLDPFWTDTVFPLMFGSVPTMVTVGQTLGASNLAGPSQGFSDYDQISSPVLNVVDDLQRVIMGSFVYSREVVRNTVYLNITTADIPNAALQDHDRVPDTTADFIVESQDIATLSVRVMISTPAIFLVLWLWILIRRKVMSFSGFTATNKGKKSTFVTRSTALSAVHLYRYLDEEICGKRRWDGRMSSGPYIRRVSQEELEPKHYESKVDIIPVSAQIGRETGLKSIKIERDKMDGEVARLEGIKDARELPQDCNPLKSRYIVPKIVPVCKRVAHKADGGFPLAPQKEVGGDDEIRPGPRTTTTSDLGPGPLSPLSPPMPTSGSTEVQPDRYELVMTCAYRPHLRREHKKVKWGQVEKVVEPGLASEEEQEQSEKMGGNIGTSEVSGS